MEDQIEKMINPVPLIPALEKPICPDTSHIIREEFQKIIGTDEFPISIAQNLVNNQIENEYLLQCGFEALNASNDLKSREEEITNAELCIMESQATYIINTTDKEINRTSIDEIYPPIDPDILERFYLLEIDNLLPKMYKRTLNNKLPPYNFIYQDPCPTIPQIDDLSICCGKPDRNLTDSQKMQLKSQKFLTDHLGLRRDYLNQIVFDVYPKHIVFQNFELFKLYEKKLVLTNKTSHLQHIVMPKIQRPSNFHIYPNQRNPRVAPGMCFSFTVGFRSEIAENSYEHLVIQVFGSQSIHVDINSYKDMPLLKGLVYHKEFMEGNISTDQKKNTIYNYTIDCGTVLYGCRSKCNFVLQNTGGKSRFFLITETDWFNRHITCITDTYKLILPDFKIYPAYFLLKKNEICELTIEFCPTEEGLLVDKLFLVADNNNVEEIDLLGDCIYFEPGFFRFEMPDCPAPFKCEGEIKNILHMGAIYYEQTIIAHFFMCNRSLISIPFECRPEELSETESFRSIKKNWVKIQPEYGIILPLSAERFEVRIVMKNKEIGLYKFKLNIFAIDIPEMSLMEGPAFTFGEEYRSKDLKQKLLTILTDKVEVQVHHIKLPVRIYPDAIIFSKLTYKTLATMSHIQVVNEGFCCLQFKWIQKEKNNRKVKIKLKPNEFRVEAMQHVSCTVFIKLKTYDDIEETLTLSINDGAFERNIPLMARVEKPKIKVKNTFVNFGHVKIHSNVTNVFTVKNLSEACLCWEVKEFQYNYVIHEFEETDNSSLSQTCGELYEFNNETDIVYKLDTSIPKKFFSILIFFTIYKYEKYESTHVFQLGYIHEPKIRIETTCDGEDIFKIENIFYVNESITKTFELHNDSLVEAKYYWGAPNGFHTKHIKFAFDFNRGVLLPNSMKYVNITLFPLKPGIIFDFYIPCYIKQTSETFILQILCVIKKPQVLIYIPGISDIIEVVWPPDYEPLSEVSDEATSLNLKDLAQYSDSKSVDFGDSISTISSSRPKVHSGNIEWDLNNIFAYLHKIEMTGEQSVDTVKTQTTTSSETKSSISLASEFGLYSKFASETSICEYVVYFLNVKCNEACKKTFKIKNPMSYPLKYSISIKHFKTKEFKRKRLEDLYINLNWKEDDSFSKQLSDYGILVIVEPLSGVLENNSETTMTITVYAETWGFYLEEISIEIEHIPTFYMNLVIQVVGQPIEMPMNRNTDGFIQFSNLQKCTLEQKRKVTLYNKSTIPCLIVWHVFLKTKLFENDAHDPFNILFDFCGFDNEPQIIGNVKIVKYIGNEIPSHRKLFRVEPTELYLEAKQSRQISVFFNPSYYKDTEINIFNIRASVVGSIYIENKNRNLNFVVRNPSKDLQLINIAIKTSITIPSLDMECVRGHANIEININDILNGDLKSQDMRLVFKNNCKSDIVVSMNVTEPFKVVSLRSRISGNFKSNNEIQAPVLINGYLEATIKCKIINVYLLNIADVLYKKVNHYLKGFEIKSKNCVQISRDLHIKYHCNQAQTLPISVTLYFPLIEVSTMHLDIGPVCLKSRKNITFKISNKTASRTWVEIVFVKYKKYLKAEPKEGFLEPYTVFPKSLYITVTFTPSSTKSIKDILRINTKIPQYYIDVNVTATGTYDEKYFYEDIGNYKCFQEQ